MIKDISYSQFTMLESQYYNKLECRRRSIIYPGMGTGSDMYIYVVLYLISNIRDRIEFSYKGSYQ